MTKTLEQNGVKDEDEEFYELNFNEEDWLPAIHIYFNDDLTEAWVKNCNYRDMICETEERM